MTLYLQEELFSLDHFDIWDEDGNVKYQVERELFQFGRKLVVVDMQGDHGSPHGRCEKAP